MGGTLEHYDHTGISCPSKGGKSVALREIAKRFMRGGNDVLVCDPLGYSWPASYVTKNEYKFLAEAKRRRNCLLLIDEPGLTDLDHSKALKWLYTTSRHNGHVCYVAMQDFTQVAKGIRKQFTQLLLFRCHPDEAKEWANQFHADREFITRHGPHLRRYEFVQIRSFEPPTGPLKLNLT